MICTRVRACVPHDSCGYHRAPALDPSGVVHAAGRYPRGSNRGDSVGIVWAAVSLHDYRRVTRRVPARIALRPLSPGPGAIARGLRGVRLMVASLIIPTAARRPSSDRVSAQGNLEEFRNYPHNANSHARGGDASRVVLHTCELPAQRIRGAPNIS